MVVVLNKLLSRSELSTFSTGVKKIIKEIFKLKRITK